MDATIDPGAGYRLLRAGEVITEGDEFHLAGRWAPTESAGYTLGNGLDFTYRRKCEPGEWNGADPLRGYQNRDALEVEAFPGELKKLRDQVAAVREMVKQ